MQAITHSNTNPLHCPCKRGVLTESEGVFTCSAATCDFQVWRELRPKEMARSRLKFAQYRWYDEPEDHCEPQHELEMRRDFIHGLQVVEGWSYEARAQSMRDRSAYRVLVPRGSRPMW